MILIMNILCKGWRDVSTSGSMAFMLDQAGHFEHACLADSVCTLNVAATLVKLAIPPPMMRTLPADKPKHIVSLYMYCI